MKPNHYLLTVIDGQWDALTEEEKLKAISLAHSLGETFAVIDFAISEGNGRPRKPNYANEVVGRMYLSGGSGTGLYDTWLSRVGGLPFLQEPRVKAFHRGWTERMGLLPQVMQPGPPHTAPPEKISRADAAHIARLEIQYWADVDDPRLQEIAIGATGALANVAAAIMMGRTPEQHAKQIEQRRAGSGTLSSVTISGEEAAEGLVDGSRHDRTGKPVNSLGGYDATEPA